MTKEDLLGKASKDLMLKEPFYGFFLLSLNKVWDKRIPTAGVSKNNINYQLSINEKFWMNLTDNHRIGLLKHELLHIAYFHLSMYFSFSDRKLANIAMDLEINQYIDKGYLPGDEYTRDQFDNLVKGIQENVKKSLSDGTITEEEALVELGKIPSRGIMFEDYADLKLEAKAGSRYYYDKLKQAKEEKEKNGSSGCPAFDGLCDQMEAESELEKLLNGTGISDSDHSTWEEFDDLTEAEKKLIDKQLTNVLQNVADQTVKKRGTIPGHIEDYLIEANKIIPPKFDWKQYIRRFTGTSTKIFTKKIRRKENKRYSESPGLKIKMKQHMLLGIDTSGSVSNDELTEFMNEIHHIYKCGVDVTIIQCDTTIRSIEAYKGKNELNIHGRGGTEFDPVLEYYNANLRKYTSLVYFTDGECCTDVKPKAPVLWVLSERSEMNDSLPGKVIKLEL